MLLIVAPLLFLTACDSQGEIDRPAPPPQPHVVEKIERSGSYSISGVVGVITMKDGDAPVPGRFTEISGDVAFEDTGTLKGATGIIKVDLGSWDSGLQLRDDRDKGTFFGIDRNPRATLTLATISGMGGKALSVGESVEGTAAGALRLYNTSADISARVRLERIEGDALRVTTVDPFSLNISAFGLGANLAALITECDHVSVDDAVSVTIDLVLAEVLSAPEAGDGEAGDAEAGDGEAGDGAQGE